MNVLNKLNQVSDKPYHGLPKLERGYHEIVGFRQSKGKYGDSVIAELKFEIIYLPQYIVEQLDRKDIEQLNKCEERLYLFFGGRHKKSR